MPAVKIEIGNKWKIETAIAIKNIVMAEVKYAFELKSSDRNIRVVRYDQDLFELKDPYEIFIEIDMVEGRSEDFKRNLYTNRVTAIENRTLFKKENIFIYLFIFYITNECFCYKMS